MKGSSMGKQIIECLVDGGKASAGPPLGPALGPLGADIKAIVDAINEKTKDMAGMKVPVKVTIDTNTKNFEIEVGTPPVAGLIKKELGIEKGSGEAGSVRAGDLTEEQVKKIARIKFGSDDSSFVKQIKGTCRSMGITIGEGAVTEEERKAVEEAKKAREAEVAAAAAEKAVPGEAPEGEVPEGEEAKEGEASTEEKKSEEKKGEKK